MDNSFLNTSFVCVGTFYSNPLVPRAIFYQPKSQKLAGNVYNVKIDRSYVYRSMLILHVQLYTVQLYCGHIP
jgi:hypothetical protein